MRWQEKRRGSAKLPRSEGFDFIVIGQVVTRELPCTRNPMTLLFEGVKINWTAHGDEIWSVVEGMFM